MHSIQKRPPAVAWCVVLLCLLATWVSAQTSLGRISGRVIDPDGAVIPAVEVMAVNEETGVKTTTQSNAAGSYTFPALNPGTYTISATIPGFKSFQRSGIRVETAQVLELDITMELGAVTETVTVTGEAPLLESTTSTVGQIMESRMMQEMPLSARRSLNLVAMTGAAVFLEGGERAKFSLAGGRARNQSYIFDGGTMQNMRLGVGQSRTDPPVTSIREFRVVQNSYSAEYGGSASGVIVATTKSGTNEFHGGVYEYFRNDKLDAAGFFAPVIKEGEKAKTVRRYNLFGGTIGGPIIKNRTHFFAAVEINKHSIGQSQILTVPTALQRVGDFSQTFDTKGNLEVLYDPATNQMGPNGTITRTPFPGNIIPAERIDPISAQLLDYYPRANRAAVNIAGAQNFSANRTNLEPREALVTRIDHVFSDANRFYFRYVFGANNSTQGSVYPDRIAQPSKTDFERPQHTLLFADTHNWTPTLLMDVRYTYGTRKNHAKSPGLGSSIVEDLGMQGVPGGAFPAIRITGFSNLGDSSERGQFPIGQHQWVNNWTWVKGTHVFKFGWEARQSWNYEINRPQISGQYNFADSGTGLPAQGNTGYGLGSFMLGFVNGFSLQDQEPLDRYNWYYAGFVQDDWRVTPDLTLNLGVRWETDTPITDRNLRFNSFDQNAINPVSGTPGVVKFGGVNGFRSDPYDTDWNNFGPRLGFAWKPGGSQNWVIRGGSGVFYEHPFAHGAPASVALGYQLSHSDASQDQGATPAFYLQEGPTGVSLGKPELGDDFGAVSVGKKPTQSLSFFETNRKAGYSMMFNFGIQRQLPGDMVLDITYMGNLARKMPNSNLQINQVPVELMGPGNKQTLRPYPQFNNVAIQFPTLGVTNYHAGVIKLQKRFSSGLSFLTTYTWSRNIGDIDQANTGAIGDNALYEDYYNRRLDKGPNAIDIVHHYTLSAVYDLPFGNGRRWVTGGALSNIIGGWTISTLGTVQSGGPFGVRVQSPKINYAAGTPRANIIGEPNLPGSERTVERWFNTEAFARPPDYTFGDSGRGVVRADGRVNFDFSLNKRFYITERIDLRFSGEFFNAFNHPDFSPPNRNLGNSNFGRITSATEGRVIQLGLQLNF
jgi:hypothetical protein